MTIAILARKLPVVLAALLMSFALAACEEEGAAEKTGKAIDEAAEEAAEAVKEGAEKVEDAAAEAQKSDE